MALLVYSLFLFASTAWGGAWCQKQGSLYSKLSYNYYYTVYTFHDDGHAKRNAYGSNFSDSNITYYLEYGLRERFTVFSSLPYKWLTTRYRFIADGVLKRKTLQYQGVGDMDLGVRYCFLETPVVLSCQFLTKVAWFYDTDEEVPPGNNQNDYELRLLAGKSLWPFPGYCGAEVGYRWRSASPSDELRYLVEVGLNLSKKISARVKLDGIKSMKNARLGPSAIVTGLSNPSLGIEYDLAKVECTVGYQQNKNWAFELTYTNNPYGKNIAQGDQYSFGLVYYYSCL